MMAVFVAKFSADGRRVRQATWIWPQMPLLVSLLIEGIDLLWRVLDRLRALGATH